MTTKNNHDDRIPNMMRIHCPVFALSLILCVTAIMTLPSCSEYDDTAATEELKRLDQRLGKLDKMCREMNGNIASLQSLAESVSKGISIVAVEELSDSEGYRLELSSGKTICLYNGKDGQDYGIYAPVVGLKTMDDGSYCWTIDGEPIMENGSPLKVSGVGGADGNTPRLKTENGFWYVSYDNGNTWKQYVRSVYDGDASYAVAVEETDLAYKFVFSDNSVVTIPKAIKVLSVYLCGEGVALSFTQFADNSFKMDTEVMELTIDVYPETAASLLAAQYATSMFVRLAYSSDAFNVIGYADLPAISARASGSLLFVTVSCEPIVNESYHVEDNEVDEILLCLAVKSGGSYVLSNTWECSASWSSDLDNSITECVIDGVVWATNNVGSSDFFNDGDRFTFSEAQSACPSGWRLPTKAELEALCGHVMYNSDGHWCSGTLDYGPGVPAILLPKTYDTELGENDCYWSSTSIDGNTAYGLLLKRWTNTENIVSAVDVSYKMAVRCVKQ